MSTELLEAPAGVDPFDGGLDQFINPKPEAKAEPDQKVGEPVVTEVVTPEVKAEEVAPVKDDLLSGISDESESVTTEKAEEEIKEYPPEIRSMKAREHFDALKASKRAAERRAAELETKVKDLESKGGIKAPEVAVLQKQYDELKEKWDEAQKELSSSFLQGTEEFKNAVVRPMQEATTGLKKFAEVYELSTSDIDAALGEPDEFKRNEMVSDIAESIRGLMNKAKFEKLVDQFITAKAKEDELYQNAEGSMEFAKTKKAEEEAAAKLKAAEEYKSARQTVIENLSTKLTDLKEEPGTWEKVVADAESVDFDSLSPKMKAFAAVAMNSIKPYQAKVATLAAKIKHLEGVIASRNAASPGAASGSVTQTMKKEGDFLDGIPIPR
jgi:hypothetical protein